MEKSRQIVLDTETTGLEPAEGHKIIEIGCVELVNRKLTGRHFHQYLNPDREIDQGAIEVHGITNEFLVDKPRFAAVAQSFLDFVTDAEVIIHNAPFDVGFLNHELTLWDSQIPLLDQYCQITDSLLLARKKHPGQRNNLDALCKRYDIDNSERDLHGALLDAEILADVYLAMTGGQVTIDFSAAFAQQAAMKKQAQAQSIQTTIASTQTQRVALKVLMANEDELAEHRAYLEKLQQRSGQQDLAWGLPQA